MFLPFWRAVTDAFGMPAPVRDRILPFTPPCEKAKAAKDYHESVNAAYENGTVAFTEAAAASKELVDAELQVAVTPRQRLDVCKSYADREAAMLRKVERLSTSGSKGGEREKHDLARLSLAKAKIVLAQERQKKAG